MSCNCGCNTCETKGPLLTEGKVKSLLSEGLQYHIDKKIPLFETVYRIGSDKHLALIKEARKMYSRNVIDLCEDDEALIGTNLGEFALYEGVAVPLDLPMLDESDSNYPDFDLDKNIRYQDTVITKGMWRYTGRESGGSGVYRNLNNDQFLAFDRSDFAIFRNNLSSHFDFSESISENETDKQELILTQIKDILKDMLKGDQDREEELQDLDLSIDTVASAITGKSPFSIDVDQDVYGRLAPIEKLKESLKENEDKLLKIKQELEALRPGTISWIDDIFISSYDGSLQVELDYTLYPDEIKQLAQIATKYGMELKYMTGKNATLVKNKINEDRNYNQEELLRLDLIAHRRFGCDYEKCTDEQKAEVLKDKVKVGVKEALQEAKKKNKKEKKDPPIGKPKRGGSKAYYVYVRDPKTKKIKKVSFGSGGLRAKIRNPKARKAFAARHNCKNKKDRTKAGYWSCNLPRYAPALGLGAKMNTFW